VQNPSHPQLAQVSNNRNLKFLILCLSVIISIFLFSHYYQFDFSAYYSAAKLLAQGRNIYIDSFTSRDGMQFIHSQFLQPPLVAVLFWPWSLFPYDIAKTVWLVVQFPLIIGILYFCTPNSVPLSKIICLTSIIGVGSFFIF
jgi:hypothetical protein